MCFKTPDDPAIRQAVATILQPQARFVRQIIKPSPTGRCTCDTCSPDKYKADLDLHPRVMCGRTARGKKYYLLNFLGHEPLDLAAAAIRSFDCNKSEMTHGQRRALDGWSAWLQKTSPVLNSGNRVELDPALMEEGITLLNRFFFLDGIKDYHFAWGYIEDSLGLTTHPTFPYVGTVHIAVNPDHDEDETQQRTSRSNAVLGTLLHELIHAFIGQFGCPSSRCKQLSCQYRFDVNYGRTGHARAWQWLAEAVERVANYRLGIKVDLGRRFHSQIEYVKTGHEPSVCDAARCFDGLVLTDLEKRLPTYCVGGAGSAMHYYLHALDVPVAETVTTAGTQRDGGSS